MTVTAAPPTALELLAEVRRLNPGVRYAAYGTGTAVGEWVASLNRFVPLYEQILGGRWVCNIVGGSIREILVNGRSVYDPDNWTE